MDTIFYLAIGAILAAAFGIGADFIKRWINTGKVTPDHLKKSDLQKLEETMQKHLDRHTECEKDFVKKEDYMRHLHDCPIKQIVTEMAAHKVDHGRVDTETNVRLKEMEIKMDKSGITFEKMTESLHSVDVKLGLMVQKVEDTYDLFFKNVKWGTELREKDE
jgi:hypothetical protein